MSDDAAATLQWLVDRTQISDLLYSFASALDNKDWQAYVANYADGGYIELPDPQTPGGTFILHKNKMLELVPKSLGRYTATHHISTNHQITIDGDKARSRSYLQAVHVGAKPLEHWSVGGWYDCRYVRTAPGGWKLSEVRLTAVWLDGNVGGIKPD
ncbi:MAG TPA: nuclear transport factor 2 family protein [Xanthobacteraceae bacterium]